MGLFKPNVEKLAARGDVKGLVKALKNKGVYAAAAEALLNIGEAAVPTLIEAMRSNDVDLGKAAAQAVSRFGKVAVPALITALKDERGGKDTVLLFINSIEGNHLLKATRVSNVNSALAEIGKAAMPALIEVMKDKDMHYLGNYTPQFWVGPGVWARLTLAQIGKAAVTALIEVLRDNDEWIRNEAAFALAEIGKAAVPALNEALKDNDERVCNEAAQVLKRLEGKK